MKLNNNIYFELYYLDLASKTEKLYEDRKIIVDSFDYFKKMLKAYEEYFKYNTSILLEDFVKNPNLPLKGKLAERFVTKNNSLKTYDDFKYYTKKYKDSYNRLKKIDDKIVSYREAVIKKKYFNKVVQIFNSKISERIVENQYSFNMGYYLGILRIVNKTTKKPKVNWGKTNENKKKLLEQGKTLYKKEEEEKAIKEGKEYLGEKYLERFSPTESWIVITSAIKGKSKYKLIPEKQQKPRKYRSLERILNDFKQSNKNYVDLYPHVEDLKKEKYG